MDLKRMLRKRSSKLSSIMDMMFEAYLTHESGHLEPDDIPKNAQGPVWILGVEYCHRDLEKIRRDVKSRLWFSYRRGFVSIGNSGLTSDKGWGCMLRCGQMVIAQALLFLHLGREWCWSPNKRDRDYLRILQMFEDVHSAPYSIHQIAISGLDEGKQVGEWFGPNTIAQVLKKLSVNDEWSSIAFHVALDNALVINDVRRLCVNSGRRTNRGDRKSSTRWKPLILIIPLRLGIAEINPVYVQGVKTCFTFRQSLGVIGGKPNHALYFIGCVGNDVIFLDPHTTQPVGFVQSKEQEHEKKVDCTYHCKHASRLPILHMDPSVAVCFFCKEEKDFDNLCQEIRMKLIIPEKQHLFELFDEKPQSWVPPDGSAEEALRAVGDFEYSSNTDDSDDDFELLG
ncbi:unnamed protein product [Bemisia tabaci]|uniref:Cysteine protease n=1 Tax=Bemisia tabaci TaxID=7038 RepID=A0A9P0EVX7_BEMTA|nr:PREDICTED: cysteine protease ATG4A [Bemisia tabaci]XP_018915251.1 PREDICTED: cysteine protease ATG4A [Bemisia tabaci]XP_018915253.1 PREDICTED: cysteine protease ATG4A [Bemisia tabaci]XP_018915254.1 PREDICTED: cysteine protease ATG4A [Bemisia tabaci]CAH0381366.1 unnamed protein product [Bemisia tabaci]